MLDVRHSEPFALLKGKPAAHLAGKLREESIRNVIARSEAKESIAGLSAIPE
jgi:hypothetical protein